MAQVSVGNYPVPNSTGANVRADINENLADLFSTSSGSTPPPAAGSATGQFWIDTSTSPDTLKVKTGSGTTSANYTTLGNIAANFGHATAASPTFTGNVGFPAGSSSSLPIRNAADTDTGILDETTMEMGITWRFKAAHGLDYAEDYRQYQLEVRQAVARNGSAPVLQMDDARRLIVSPYSYNLNDGNYGLS